MEYRGRLKIAHHQAKRMFAPLRIECNLLPPDAAARGGNCTLEKNVDYASSKSHVHSVKATSARDCCARCSADAQCAAGVYSVEHARCWLKSVEDTRHKLPARSGIPTVACIPRRGVAPAPSPKVACTVAD